MEDYWTLRYADSTVSVTVYSDRGCTVVTGTRVKGDTMSPLVCAHSQRVRATHLKEVHFN